MISVLYLASNPLNTEPLRLDEEFREISAALVGTELTLFPKFAVRLQDLQPALLEVDPTLVHFTGHGDEQGDLLLENAIGYPEAVPADCLGDALALCSAKARCVILNACNTAIQAKTLASVVEAVIGVEGTISVGAARIFVIHFYRGIASRLDISRAFHIALNQMAMEWPEEDGKPVLFMHGESRPLIYVEPVKGTTPTNPGGETEGPDVFSELQPTVFWCLPRGFILIDSLESEGEGWGINAHYFDYDGSGQGGTHYHPAYGRREDLWASGDSLRVQCMKLGIPPGDSAEAQRALGFMVDVREGRYVVDGVGRIRTREGEPYRLPSFAKVFGPGQIKRPNMPSEFGARAASGSVRDLAAQLAYIREDRRKGGAQDDQDEAIQELGRIRRRARIEVESLLGNSHPAAKNLEEIIAKRPTTERDDLLWDWARELAEALHEAANSTELNFGRLSPMP